MHTCIYRRHETTRGCRAGFSRAPSMVSWLCTAHQCGTLAQWTDLTNFYPRLGKHRPPLCLLSSYIIIQTATPSYSCIFSTLPPSSLFYSQIFRKISHLSPYSPAPPPPSILFSFCLFISNGLSHGWKAIE